uniref:Uncharacterized protein n=1 Tax=Thermogemmatispora argillosa TaxID=2045280 RepID=A0A455SYI1_9CHLR|nr:hypothetical protein KTA_03580 [Thermogemmatispora argillosa]
MLTQIAAVRSGLNRVAQAILEQYLHERMQKALAQRDASLAMHVLREALDRLLFSRQGPRRSSRLALPVHILAGQQSAREMTPRGESMVRVTLISSLHLQQ